MISAAPVRSVQTARPIRARLGYTSPTTSYISSGIGTAGTIAAAAIGGPIGLAVAGAAEGAALLFSALGIGSGCGPTCITTSNYANQFTANLQTLQQSWAATRDTQGGCITSDQRATFLQAFDGLWTQLSNACQQVGGQGGKQCIADRQRGGKYDAFAAIRDPITNTPICGATAATGITIAPAPIAVSGSAAATSWWPLAIPAALLAAAWVSA
jgi:hypothetical protein